MTSPMIDGQSIAPQLTPESLARLEARIWPHGFSRDAWMIVDAARDNRTFGLLLEYFYSQHVCLFDGNIPPELRLAAPYLVQLDYDDRKTRKFLAQAWNKSWMIILKCDAQLGLLKRHFGALMMVLDERGRQLLFRYYDPRVLRVYLPTCTPEELRTFFGPVNCFLLEDELPDTVIEFHAGKALVKHIFVLHGHHESGR